MKKVILLAAFASTLVFTQCSRTTDNKVDEAQESIVEDIKDQKAEVAKDLRTLRDDINTRLDDISKKIEKGNIETRKNLETVKDELTVQRDKVEKALDNIDKSSDESWDDIQQASRNTANEIKVDFQRLRERIDLALDSEKDNDKN
jgi:hypothetical protein